MSDIPPTPPLELSYETPQPSDKAAMMLRLAAIFLFVSGGLDLVAVAYQGLMLAMRINFVGVGVPRAPASWAHVLLTIIPIVECALSVVIMGLKVIGGLMLLRGNRHAWGWGLAAGIAGCVHFWSCPCCLASIADGTYTIVILCLPQVKAYLRAEGV